MKEEKIFEILKNGLINLFEIPAEKITMQARIYEDLEIDSIDAIDLIDHLKKETGYKMQANDFKEVKTLEDIVKIISAQLEKNSIK